MYTHEYSHQGHTPTKLWVACPRRLLRQYPLETARAVQWALSDAPNPKERRRVQSRCLVVERHTSPHISHQRVVENLRHLCRADRGLGYGHGKELLWADGVQHVIHLKLHC